MKDTWQEASAVAGFVSLVYTAVAQPWSKDAKARRAERRMLKLFMRGSPESKGFYEAIASGPERVKKNEDDIRLLKGDLAKIKRGTEHAIAETKKVHAEVRELRELWTVNGGRSNRPGEVQMRQAKETGAWLDNPEDTAPV